MYPPRSAPRIRQKVLAAPPQTHTEEHTPQLGWDPGTRAHAVGLAEDAQAAHEALELRPDLQRVDFLDQKKKKVQLQRLKYTYKMN